MDLSASLGLVGLSVTVPDCKSSGLLCQVQSEFHLSSSSIIAAVAGLITRHTSESHLKFNPATHLHNTYCLTRFAFPEGNNNACEAVKQQQFQVIDCGFMEMKCGMTHERINTKQHSRLHSKKEKTCYGNKSS